MNYYTPHGTTTCQTLYVTEIKLYIIHIKHYKCAKLVMNYYTPLGTSTYQTLYVTEIKLYIMYNYV
jgi:hypothetical protein